MDFKLKVSNQIVREFNSNKNLLAILIDPEKFELSYAFAKAYLQKLPSKTTHLLLGGSTDPKNTIKKAAQLLKELTSLPLILFPGSHMQITNAADGILFLSLVSGRNPEYLIGQQVAAAPILKKTSLEVIPTGYILIDGGLESAVAQVSETQAMPQDNIPEIINTALAAQFLGKKCIYLEAGSGAKTPVSTKIIEAVKNAVSIPIIVGGGIHSQKRVQAAYDAGAKMVVVGTAFEEDSWNEAS
jgi:putative glycerol-1-phosphate prenyltransferase